MLLRNSASNVSIALLANMLHALQVFVEEHLAVFVLPIVFFQVDASTKHFVADGFASKANNDRALARSAHFILLRPDSVAALQLVCFQFDSARVSFEPQQSQ